LNVKEWALVTEITEQAVETVAGKKVKKRHHVVCPRCGSNHLSRLSRVGFLQKKIYPIFGYFPWQCTGCKGRVMIKKRGGTRRSKKRDSGAK
jgi:DNA-directed RNA polymerase subunit RPC12/RpoP